MKRRVLTPEFKKKIAIEALREQKTINEIAAIYNVHPVQVSKWKNEFLKGASVIFEDPRKKKKIEKSEEQDRSFLEQKIGQLTVEIDWLKKKLHL